MNITLVKALIVLIPAAVLAARSAFIIRRNAVAGLLQLSGSLCLAIVALTHVAEALHVMPFMGWGQAHSAGHYVDLTSALMAVTLLPVGYLWDLRARRRGAY